MNDRTKIRLLSQYSLLSTGAIIGMGWLIHRFADQYQKDQQKKALLGLAVSRFIERSPRLVSEQVLNDMEFKWITDHLEDLKENK